MGFGKLYLCRPSTAFWYKQHLAIQIVPEMEKSGHVLTLMKSTYPEDLDCFSLLKYKEFGPIRGPDWDKTNIMFSRRFNLEQLDELTRNSRKDSQD